MNNYYGLFILSMIVHPGCYITCHSLLFVYYLPLSLLAQPLQFFLTRVYTGDFFSFYIYLLIFCTIRKYLLCCDKWHVLRLCNGTALFCLFNLKPVVHLGCYITFHPLFNNNPFNFSLRVYIQVIFPLFIHIYYFIVL